jgi:hypothetical protein
MNGVVWVDGGSPDNILISQKTSDPQDLYWELNTVGIALQIDEANSGRTFLKFETVTPNFSHLLLRTGGKEKEWKDVPQNKGVVYVAPLAIVLLRPQTRAFG